jgi:hypothetical protein
MKTPFPLFVCLIFSFMPHTEGKPLVRGTMVMQENDESGHALSIDHTFNPHFAPIPK